MRHRTGVKRLLGLVALVGVVGGPRAFSQSETSAWIGEPPVVESVSEIMARAAAAPQVAPGIPRSRARRRIQPAGASGPALGAAPRALVSPGIAPPRAAETVGVSFLAVQSSESVYIPPDTMGAVGPTQILVCVNGRIKVFDRAGNLDTSILNVTTDTFFASVLNGSSATDCRVRFDRDSGRWFVTMINVETTNNRVMIAVSKGSSLSPGSLFSFYYFNQNVVSPAGNNNLFADYPTLGIDHNALYMGVNLFTAAGGFRGSTGFVIQKSALVNQLPIVATALRNLASAAGAGAYTPQGVDNDDATATKGFLVGVDISSVPSTRMVAVRVLNPGSVSPAPSIDATLDITVPSFGSALGGVPAKGSTTVIDDVDNRLMMAQMKAGNLWTVHNINVDSSGNESATGGRDGARWYEVGGLTTSSPSVVQSGTVFDPAAANPGSYFVPSIAASGQGHAALGATRAGPNEFCEVAVTGRLSGDPAGTLQAPTIVQTSTTAYNVDPADPAQRWGDFSFTCIDPNDNMTFWTFQEYCNATNSWGVRVIQLRAPPPATPSSVSGTLIAQNQSSVFLSLTGTSVSGSGFYDPGAGFANRLQVSLSGGVTVTGVTYVNPTALQLSFSTVGAALGPVDVTVTNPDGQSLTGTGLFTVTSGAGAPTCAVTPSGTDTNTSPIVFTMTFSEAVTGFTGAGITLTNGTAGIFTPVNATTYTLAVTPLAQGSVTCQVSAGPAIAVSDNQSNLVSNTASVLYDTGSPTAPGTPSGSPNPNPGTFTVSWTAATDAGGSGIASYTVQRSANGGAFATIASGVAGLSLPQSGLAQGSYQYQVLAINGAGTTGPASGISSAVVVDPGPPGPPGTPVATPNPNAGTFTVSWTAATDPGGSGIASYTVQRSANGGAFTTIASGVAGLSVPQSGLAQGSYQYQVLAVNGVGTVGSPSGVSAAVIVDTTPPGAPGTPVGAPSPNNTGAFTVTWTAATDTGGSGVASYTVQRSANGGAFATVASGVAGLALPQSGLVQGSYQYQVLAVDGAGNVGPAGGISLPVIVDTTPPGAPGTPVGAPSPNNTGAFTVTWTAATDTGGSGVASYTVRRSANGGAFATVASGVAGLSLPQSGLVQGSYQYQVLAVDGAGNTGPGSPVSAPVVVDTTPPSAPGTPVGTPNPTNGNFTLSWTAATDTGGSGLASYAVQRSLNGGAYAQVATGVAGTSLAQNGLPQGAYRFQVQATDAAGNVGPWSAPSGAVVVNTTPPHTTILAAPPNPSSSAGAAFLFNSSVADCTFQTKLDGGAWTSNGSAQSVSYAGLANGSHTFQVRAVDSAGNVDPTPPSYTWTVNTTGGVNQSPATLLTAHPSNPTAQTSATFTFISTEPGGTFDVQLDGGGWISNGASGTKTYTSLALGSHTFQVRAVDTALNVDPNPPSFTWSIVSAPVDQTAPLLNTFDNNVAITNWTLSGSDALVTWAVDGTPASMIGGAYHSAPSSLNYNNGTNYDTPGLSNNGTATSPAISISGLTGARLKFFCNYQTETPGTDHDVRFVQVSNNGFTTYLVNEQLSTTPGSALAGACASMGTWHEHVIPLAGMSGPIQVQFHFDTLDAALNAFPGWFVDDFEISDLYVSGLNQYTQGSGTPLPVGGTSGSTSMSFGGVISQDATSSVTLQVEVQPVGTPFTGIPTGSATTSGPGNPISVSLTVAGNGSYHWQARTVTGGITSSWMSFGLNAETDPDFIVQVSSPAPAAAAGGGGGGGHHCGLSGWESMVLLAASGAARRRQKRRGRGLPHA